MNIEEIREKLKDRNLSYVAAKIGMSRQQLWNIARGKNDNPRANTMLRIEKYLKGEHKGEA